MPKMYFNKNIKILEYQVKNKKLDLLKKLNVDFVITKKFNKEFSKTKSIDFIKNT